MDNNLIIVDAGHGGIDSGAVGNGLEEKDLNLRASKYMYNRLKELGIPVVITRNEDEYLPKNDRINKILSIVRDNPNKKIILISNHINAGGAEGAEVVYSLKNKPQLAEMIINNIGEQGQKTRKIYQRRLPENPNKDYYYILRESNTTEPLLIEYGFIDNNNDSKKLQNNIEKYAEGVVKALADYLGYNYLNNITSIYTVQKGDTLYSLSKRFNIPVQEIIDINNLTSDILSIGQIIKLTKEEKDNINLNKYIVQKGDSLYSISKLFNINVNTLKEINNLNNNIISIGEELLIPNNNDNIIENEETKNYTIYIVQKGDSLWGISKKFNIPVNELIQINNLDNLTLSIGQELLVPDIEYNSIYYTVQKGDTLWSIANKNNIDVNTLKEINNLNSNLLTIGQQLIITK